MASDLTAVPATVDFNPHLAGVNFKPLIQYKVRPGYGLVNEWVKGRTVQLYI